MTTTTLELDPIVDQLLAAEARARPTPQLTLTHPDLDVATAYRIQRQLVARKEGDGARIVGKKAGLTSESKQRQVGVMEPIYGYVLDRSLVDEGTAVPASRYIHPRVEPELAFVLGQDLAGPGVTVAQALAATAYVVPALEIIDSRYQNFQFTLPDVVADNTSAAGVVLGAGAARPAAINLRLVGLVLEKNGEVVDTGAGAAVMGNPAIVVAWLANRLGAVGESLRAGEIVMCGAFCPAVAVGPGDHVRAEIDGLGAVSIRFT